MTSLDVLRVITRLNVGGPARQAIFLTGAMPARGFPSQLVWGRVGPGEGQFDPPTGMHNTHIPWLRREMSPRDDARAFRALHRLMKVHRPTIVHTHMAKAGALGRLAATRARVPVVVHTFHGHVLEGYFSAPVNRALLTAERRLARRADALVAVSPAVCDELLELGIGRPEQWRVVPVGLELGSLLAGGIEPVAARRTLGLPETGPVVGIVGRLVPIKDHATFLEAAARVASTRPEVTFVVAGDGELRDQIERRARGMLGGRCRFLGWVMDLPTLYAALDIVVLTSLNEGTPVALIEAGAAATTAVSTRVGGVADVIRDGVTGFLAPHGDPEAVASHVLQLLEDPKRTRLMGHAAREWVRERFSSERLADDLAGLYRELSARKLDRLTSGNPAKGEGEVSR
ncbi:MAG: glycosyltransferase family 4 protein [Actinomycetota bacterium]